MLFSHCNFASFSLTSILITLFILVTITWLKREWILQISGAVSVGAVISIISIMSNQALIFLNEVIEKAGTGESFIGKDSYIQFRVVSIKWRLLKYLDIINDTSTKEDLATHSSYTTIFKKLPGLIYGHYGYTILVIVIFISCLVLIYATLGINFAILFGVYSFLLDPVFSGYSLTLPMLAYIVSMANIKNKRFENVMMASKLRT